MLSDVFLSAFICLSSSNEARISSVAVLSVELVLRKVSAKVSGSFSRSLPHVAESFCWFEELLGRDPCFSRVYGVIFRGKKTLARLGSDSRTASSLDPSKRSALKSLAGGQA